MLVLRFLGLESLLLCLVLLTSIQWDSCLAITCHLLVASFHLRHVDLVINNLPLGVGLIDGQVKG
jgi:hypothetical protein